MTSPGAWGSGRWGAGPWGGGVGALLTLTSALAVRENVVRLFFSQPVYFSSVLDPPDASNIVHYTIDPVDGSTDQLGQPARPVNVIFAQLPNAASSPPVDPGAVGTAIDLLLDRPMSSLPASYTVNVFGLMNDKQTTSLDPTSVTFPAVYRELSPPSLETAAPMRDIANPQTLAALKEVAPDVLNAIATFVVGDDGDYAFDQGVTNLKKRVIRRIFTKKGGFLHLPNYGVGITSYGKKLARLDTIGKITTDARIQIQREPDVAKALISSDVRRTVPEMLRLHIAIKPRGARSQKFTVNVPIT